MVFETDLDEADEAKLTDYPHPYAMALDLPDTERDARVGGSTSYRTVIDVVLEHRPINGVRSPKRPLIELRQLVLALPDFVDELAYSTPLTQSLRCIGGVRKPMSKPEDPQTLFVTCRFAAAWRF